MKLIEREADWTYTLVIDEEERHAIKAALEVLEADPEFTSERLHISPGLVGDMTSYLRRHV